MKRSLQLLVIATLALCTAQESRAQSSNEPWGLEFADGSRSVAMDTDVRVEVNGLAARVEVRQYFQNLGDDWMEATYRYPLPPGASVDRMEIESGGRLVVGEIQEKAEATRRYQKARAAGAVASLVEQQRRNQFQTSIANIAPGATVRVSIGFLVQVDYRQGIFSLELPVTFTPRADSPDPLHLQSHAPRPVLVSLQDNPVDDHYFTLDMLLNTGMELARIESPWHDVDIHPALGGYRVFLADPDNRADRNFSLQWAPAFGDVPRASLSTYDSGEAVYAMLMLAPPLAGALQSQPREVVFIIDTSGSMEGDSIRQAREALLQGLEFLGTDDRFNLIRFSSDTEMLFEESVPAWDGYLQQSLEFIESLRADGGTVMAPALAQALALPEQPGLLRQIVFITDGSVGNENQLLLQLGEHLGDSRLFPVSIGAAPNNWFMRKSAEIGRGTHTRIGSGSEVAEQMALLWSRIQTPAIQDLCVDWGMEADFYPEVIPDLYAGEPLWLYARLPREPREITLCGELDGRYWESRVPLNSGGGSDDLAALWARQKVEALEDSRIFGIPAEEIREAVLDLALDYGLLTAYTSMIAVDHTTVRPENSALQQEQVPGLLPAGSAPSAAFSQTATGWPLQILFSALSLLTVTAMLLWLPPSRAKRKGDGRQPMAPSPGSTAPGSSTLDPVS